MLILLLLFVYAILAASGMVLMKIGGKGFNINKNNEKIVIGFDYRLFLGILMYIISFGLWSIILQLFPVVYISPIGYGINIIFTAIFAFTFLKEKVNLIEIIGVITIIIGVIIVSFKF